MNIIIALCTAMICTSTPVYIVDGDTIKIGSERIRLQGFDAPEMDGSNCGNREARAALVASLELSRHLQSGKVSIKRTGYDRYGRTLANIHLGDIDVGQIMINTGHARQWPNGERTWCK